MQTVKSAKVYQCLQSVLPDKSKDLYATFNRKESESRISLHQKALSPLLNFTPVTGFLLNILLKHFNTSTFSLVFVPIGTLNLVGLNC